MKCEQTTNDGILIFWCPGCKEHHGVWVNEPNDLTGAKWNWNQSFDSPTFTPSILIKGTVPVTDEEATKIMRGEEFEPKPRVCHSFVTNGYIQYLNDCTHDLAGQIMELEDLD